MNLKFNFGKSFWNDYVFMRSLLNTFSFFLSAFVLFYYFFKSRNINPFYIFNKTVAEIFGDKNFYFLLICISCLIFAILNFIVFISKFIFIKSFESTCICLLGIVSDKKLQNSILHNSSYYLVQVLYKYNNENFSVKVKCLINKETDLIKKGSELKIAVKENKASKPLIVDLYFETA